MSIVALLLAAGRGRRMGRGIPKAFVPLVGRPLLLHALDALLAVPRIDHVVPVLGAAELERWPTLVGDVDPSDAGRVAPPVAGGAERQDSVRAGMAALPQGTTLVAVHDAARALVRPETVGRVLRVAEREGAAILAVPVRDTIKRVADERIQETPPRSACWAAQTPQVFRAELLREALDKAAAESFLGTDDAELVERLGVPVHVVEGDPDNLKITHPEDLVLAEHVLATRGEAGS